MICSPKENLMKNVLTWLVNPPTTGSKSTLVLRLMAGGVFFVGGNPGSGAIHEVGHAVSSLDG
jgi:hypothetical protein